MVDWISEARVEHKKGFDIEGPKRARFESLHGKSKPTGISLQEKVDFSIS